MFDWNSWIIVLPARLRSTRLPEKPLQDLCGRPLIARVYDRLSPIVSQGGLVIVATDSKKIFDVCQQLNIPCEMTLETHESGTDRVFEVSQRHNRPFILNVQGDEPFVHTEVLESLAQRMVSDTASEMGTVVYKNQKNDDYINPNIVKAIVLNNKANYFSRSPIPYHRDSGFTSFWQHQGIYAFRSSTLAKFCQSPLDPLEKLEKLEQLRALGLGIAILVVESKFPAIGIDTPDDLEEAREIFSQC